MLHYFWPGKSILFYAGLISVIGLFTVFAKYTYTSPSSCQVDFYIETSAPVDFSIYYDIGDGLREEDQQSKYVEQANEKTKVSFCIPTYNELRGLRFDPSTRPVQMKIHRITLSYSDGTVFNVPFDTLNPGNQIERHEIRDSSFFFETEKEADDPTFSLTRIKEQQQGNERWSKILHYGLWLCSALILMTAGRFVYRFFFLGL